MREKESTTIEGKLQAQKAYLEGRISRRQAVLSKVSQEEEKNLRRKEKLEEVKERFQQKIASFRAKLERVAVIQAQIYLDLVGCQTKEVQRLKKHQGKSPFFLEIVKTHEEELRSLNNQPSEDPFLQRGLDLLQKERVKRRKPSKSPRGLGELLVVPLIEKLSSQHLEKKPTLEEISQELGITRERARQLASKAQKENPLLRIEKRGERISLCELAKMAKTTPPRLIQLLEQGRISLGYPTLDQYFFSLPPEMRSKRKFILPQNLDLNGIRQEVQELAFPQLTFYVARHHPDLYLPLSTVVKEAGLKARQNIPFIAERLIEAGFPVQKFAPWQKKARYYYFISRNQGEEIIAYLKTNPPKQPIKHRPRNPSTLPTGKDFKATMGTAMEVAIDNL